MITKKNIVTIIVVLIAIPFLPLLVITGGLAYARIAGTDRADDGCVPAAANEAGFYDITAGELKARVEDTSDNSFIIVDIRDDASFDKAHIPGAFNIPLNEFAYRMFSLDKTSDIIVYCYTGVTSRVACQMLVNAGFKDVYNLTGGIKTWNYAVETTDGRVNI